MSNKRIPFNQSQRLGLDIDRHIALDAGAGTGKTTVMAERYVQHLLSPVQRSTLVLPHGPREPLSGHGSLRAPARERTDRKEWKGLLPSEVVAITFTKKAASELKARIRARVAQTRRSPVAPDDEVGIFDPRVGSDADIEMLLSSLDEAPISTIDAFLSQLLSPHLDLVAVHPSREQIAPERAPLLIEEALHSAWRVRTVGDAQEAGVLGYVNSFIESRDRLSIALGGQAQASIVLSGMLNKSLFVEESRRAIEAHSQRLGVPLRHDATLPEQLFLEMFTQPVVDQIDAFAVNLHRSLNEYVDLYLAHSTSYVAPAEADANTDQTRFNHLVHLARHAFDEDPIVRTQWVWSVAIAAAGAIKTDGSKTTYFPNGALPPARKSGWHAGLATKSKAKVSKAEKEQISIAANSIASKMSDLLNGEAGRLIGLMGRCSTLFSPLITNQFIPEGSTHDLHALDVDLPESIPEHEGMRVGSALQSRILLDLLRVHEACKEILTQLKAQEGVHDFADIQNMAADLLLARCPDMVRYDYPPAVVDALDDLGDEPWADHHISRALNLASEDEACLADLQRRLHTLQVLRRQFRAFIIDEYQDTNPAHFRLLARLWGHRALQHDEPARPLGPWDPTVCIVGDMKQSIYRFRQAEVSVMRRAVAAVMMANELELSESRWPEGLRLEGHGRDPRPIGAGGETAAFIVANSLDENKAVSQAWQHVSLGEDMDGYAPEFSGNDRQRFRGLGLIDMTSNYRTKPNLVHTMNGIFRDVFDARHHLLPGEWHATAQDLVPGRPTGEQNGVLEWLMPLVEEEVEQPTDLTEPVNVFADSTSNPVHLEHELIAARLSALLQGQDTRVWSASTSSFVPLEAQEKPISASDVMILVHSRTHVPDLMRRLQSRGIPVVADRQGALLGRPIVQPLMAALNLIANPASRAAVLGLARSPVLGFTDAQIQTMMGEAREGDWWGHLQQHSDNQHVAALLHHLRSLVHEGALYEVLDAILDHSDLLVAFPDDTDRQNAEAWYTLVVSIGNELGHEAAAIHTRLCELQRLGQKGPQATSVPPGGAVQIMTVHNAKGLEADVVFVAGMFKAGASDAKLNTKENVLVTPQIIAGRINPWRSVNRPHDGLWEFTLALDKAQTQAERRRSFYVALTRARDRLILVGAYSNKTLPSADGQLEIKTKASKSTMGGMWLEGLRSLAHQGAVAESPWLVNTDLDHADLRPYGERTLSLDPYALYEQAQLGEESVDSIRIYTHPDCFETSMVRTPLNVWQSIEERLEAGLDASSTETSSLTVSESVRMTAHGLDTSYNCRRRHWLAEVKGWVPERFNLLTNHTTNLGSTSLFPMATVFGTMMHRLVELGLANPSASALPHSRPLPAAWQYGGEDRLDDMATIDVVLNEEGYSRNTDGANEDIAERTAERLAHLGRLVRDGLLGRWSVGEQHCGLTVEGLRTELPFYHRHGVPVDGLSRSKFDVNGPVETSVFDALDLVFDGRADLVLALRDEKQRGYLQIVDLKTSGCRDGFNAEDATNGSPLQQYSGDLLHPEPSTDAERALLHEHRLQLTLYSVALEAIESQKPLEERRGILPPALLVGASGRLIQLSEEEFSQARTDLNKQLQWIGHLAAVPDSLEEPPRLDAHDAHHCQTCPFFAGKVRLCGPQGSELGFIEEPVQD